MNTAINREQLPQVIAKLIEDTFARLKERPTEQYRNEIEDVHKEMVVTFERAIRGLLFTIADSLNDMGNKTALLVTEEGILRREFVRAINHRVGCDIDFPEFTTPLAECFYREACLGNLSTARWKIITGEARSVYLEAVSEKD